MSVKSEVKSQNLTVVHAKSEKDIYDQYRPHSGIRYDLSQTELHFDGGITKVHLKQTTVEYEPGQDLTTPPTIESVKKYAKQRGRGPIWVFPEEIEEAKKSAKQGDNSKAIAIRIKAREREVARTKVGTHKELIKRIGPAWYQELSNKQMSSADELKTALLGDYKEGTICRTQDVFRNIGLVLWPNHTKIEYSLKKFYKCPVEFLLSIYNLTKSADDEYSLNDKIILSSVVHLTIRDTLRELHLRIPSPTRVKRPKRKPKKPEKRRKSKLSPYMEPFFFAEQGACEGIYKDTHKQCASSRYFNYVDDMYDTYWEIEDTVYSHKLLQSKYALPPKIPVRNIASKMVRIKRFRLKKPSLYHMACGPMPDLDKKKKDSVPEVIIPNDGKCHCEMRMSPSLLEYVESLNEHLARVRFPCGCLRNKAYMNDPCYMASNVCPCSRLAEHDNKFEACTCCADIYNPQGCQCCCNREAIIQNVSNTVDVIQMVLDSNTDQIAASISLTKEIQDMLNTNIDAIRTHQSIVRSSQDVQEKLTSNIDTINAYTCPFKCGGQAYRIEESWEAEEDEIEGLAEISNTNAVCEDEECKPKPVVKRRLCSCCQKKEEEAAKPKPWMADTFNWDDPYSLCTCAPKPKPCQEPSPKFLESLLKYNEENQTDYYPCHCHGGPEENQYKICECGRAKEDKENFEEIAEENKENVTEIDNTIQIIEEENKDIAEKIEENKEVIKGKMKDKKGKVKEDNKEDSKKKEKDTKAVIQEDGNKDAKETKKDKKKKGTSNAGDSSSSKEPKGRGKKAHKIEVHASAPQMTEEEIAEQTKKDNCLCYRMYADYMNLHEECLDLYTKYQQKIKQDTEEHIEEIEEVRCNCRSNPDSSNNTTNTTSTTFKPASDTCTCVYEEDLINYCHECMGEEEYIPDEEYDACGCTHDRLFMCTCGRSETSSDDKKDPKHKGKKKKKKRKSCDQEDEEQDEMEKKIFKIDKFPRDHYDQMDLLQDALIELEKDGYPLAKLPDCHLLPHFKLWLAKRTRECISQAERIELAAKSKTFWNHIDICRRKIEIPSLGLSKRTMNHLTWGGIFKHRKLIESTKTGHYRRFKQACIDETQEFFASTYHHQLPNKTFRDCFFSYFPSDENHCFVIKPWQPHEFRQMVGKSCSSSS